MILVWLCGLKKNNFWGGDYETLQRERKERRENIIDEGERKNH